MSYLTPPLGLSEHGFGTALGPPPTTDEEVLFVDLDGPLVATDLLWEALLLALKRDPRVLLQLPGWLGQGRAVLRRKLAEQVAPDIAVLPFRAEVLEVLREHKSRGGRLVLVTASDPSWAQEVAEHLGIFDDVLGLEGMRTLKGEAKLQALARYGQQRGFADFAYIGDSAADLPIWQQAARAYAVAPSASLLAQLKARGKSAIVLGTRRSPLRAGLRALRPQQWLKNLLLFAPLILAQEFAVLGKVVAAVLAFLAFCACASSIYLLNDLFDIEADRHHPSKRRRPFASGALPIRFGPVLAVGLLVFGFGTALGMLPWAFSGMLAFYLGFNLLYSLWLKRKIIADVLLLAGLYTLRVLAGGIATGIPVSEWLLIFSLFLFISLAFAKRYAELSRLTAEGREMPEWRGYLTTDLSLIESIGPASGYLAVLVFGLYIKSHDMKHYYTVSWALWLIFPLLLYWVSRVWFMAKRRLLSEDPVVFAVTDGVSRLVVVLVGILFVIAISGQ